MYKSKQETQLSRPSWNVLVSKICDGTKISVAKRGKKKVRKDATPPGHLRRRLETLDSNHSHVARDKIQSIVGDRDVGIEAEDEALDRRRSADRQGSLSDIGSNLKLDDVLGREGQELVAATS